MNGVAEFTLGLAEGKTRGLAYVPAIHVFLNRREKDVDARIRGHDGHSMPAEFAPAELRLAAGA